MDTAWDKNRLIGRQLFLLRSIVLLISVIVLCGLSGCASQVKPDQESIQHLEFGTIQNIIESTSFLQEAEIEFETAFAGSYAYDCLTENEQIWYRDINTIVGNLQENIELSAEGIQTGLDENDIEKIFQYVLIDHPEYFFVEGYTYTSYIKSDKLVKLEFSGTYSMDVQEARKRRQEIEREITSVIGGIDRQASDYEKIKYVYETLIRETEYDQNAPDNQNIYSVFVNHRSVCQGYAKATQYLLNYLGVECTLAAGTVENGIGHAWNLVKADGDYYYVDATWGDASYLLEDSVGEQEGSSQMYLPRISYDYLCITTAQLMATHTLDKILPMPECTDMENNYYVREGIFFTSTDREKLAAVFQKARESGKKDVTIKCSDQAVYDEMNRVLIEEQGIFQYFPNADEQIAFAQNIEQLSVTFWVTNE